MRVTRLLIALALGSSLLACGELVSPVEKAATSDTLPRAHAPGPVQASRAASNYAIGW